MKKLQMSRIVSLVLALCMMFSVMQITVFADEVTFSDMPDNWATAALKKAVENNLLAGSDGKIMPDASLTRAQMATIMSRAFGATELADISSFSDVKEDAWYYEYMAKAVKMGVFKGDGASLNPENNITREEAFTVLARAFALENAGADVLVDFVDKDSVSSWAVPTVAAIVKNNYAKGSDGYLNPNSNITRAEFAVLMDNIVKVYITSPGVCNSVEKGNVVVRTNGVTFSGVKIEGDLILGPSIIAKGVILKNSSVTGRIVGNDEKNKIEEISTEVGGGGASGGPSGGQNNGSGTNNGTEDTSDEHFGLDGGIEDGGEFE